MGNTSSSSNITKESQNRYINKKEETDRQGSQPTKISTTIKPTQLKPTEKIEEKKLSDSEEKDVKTNDKSVEDPKTEKKIWHIYYDNTEQKVAVYPGSQISEILAAIHLIYSFPESQELLFLDEDGTPVILSSAIPSGTRLYMQKKRSVTDMVFSQNTQNPIPPQSNWYWLEPSNKSHKRKNNNLTVYQPDNQTQSHCFGSLVLKSGRHYFTLLVEPMMCCVYAGIGNANDFNQERFSSEFLNEISLKYLLEGSKYVGLASVPTHEIGFLVDMDQKILTITDHRNKKVLVKKPFVWEEVRPVVYFKHEVSITITNGGLPVPAWI